MSVSAMVVTGCGMTTAVGLTAEASCAAIRARLDGFHETRFAARASGWIVGAEAPLEQPWRGLSRLAQLAARPIQECLRTIPQLPTVEIPVLLGTAEANRPGRAANLDQTLLPLIEDVLGLHFHSASRVIPMGRVAGAVGLREAARLMNQCLFPHVIIAGVDSYLVAATLDFLDERDRLLSARNSNGLIPGEAGAAVLVGPDDRDSGLLIRSLGLAVESATIDSDEALRGYGLAAAYRQALAAAGVELHQINYRICDISGEQYRFKEAALVVARLMRQRTEFQDIWHPADCIGEMGAAATPCLLAVAFWAARKGYAPGRFGLVHAGNDDGRRAAIVLDGRRSV